LAGLEKLCKHAQRHDYVCFGYWRAWLLDDGNAKAATGALCLNLCTRGSFSQGGCQVRPGLGLDNYVCADVNVSNVLGSCLARPGSLGASGLEELEDVCFEA
jgi:hypothetical protein